MKVAVCIGSSCHLKGSRQVVDGLEELVVQNGLADKVDVCGAFCMGNCKEGVSVSIEDTVYSVTPETVNEFFEKEIKAKV